MKQTLMQTLQTNNLKRNLRNDLAEWDKREGKKNLIFLMEEILGYPKMGQIHQEVQQFLNKIKTETKKGIILLPRNHLKTTTITISWTIQQLLNNPDLRIFITNERLDNASSFLREIKNHFEKNEKLKFLYGNYVNEEGKWSQTQIIVRPRKKNFKEPSIQVGSLDSSLVSQHYDIIIADDLVSRNNIATKEQMDKVKQYWKDLISLQEIGGIVLDVGTRWNFDDLHGYLLKDNGYDKLIKSCWDTSKQPIFPEKFKQADLQDIKNSIGSYDFSCLYENSPTDNENSAFKRSYFETRYKELELTDKRLNTFITIDNAPSTKRGSDFSGIIVNSVDQDNKWYLRHVERFKGNSPSLINKIFELWQYYNPIIIGIEQKSYEDLIKPFLDEECRRRNQFPNVQELKDKGLRKEDRIQGRLQGRFETHSIYLQQAPIDNTEDLVDELIRFPVGQHDDLADALQYQAEIAFKPDAEDALDNYDIGIYNNQNYS